MKSKKQEEDASLQEWSEEAQKEFSLGTLLKSEWRKKQF